MKNTLLFIVLLFSTQLNAQNCNASGHSVNSNDSWMSCELAINPNPTRGITHWVMYDLGYVYSLGTIHFWNYNVEGETMNGMRNISVDVSLNGTDWSDLGSFQLAEASGNSDYEGEEGIHLAEANVRYVLITAQNTWGGSCAGLSEVRFDIAGTVALAGIENESNSCSLYPNPANNALNISLNNELIKEVIIHNSAGYEVLRVNPHQNHLWIDLSLLPAGVYHCQVIGDHSVRAVRRFVKAF